MPRIPFEELPDHGRLWVFPIDRPLNDAEAERTLSVVDDFLAQWAAHGSPLRSARELREGRFLLVGVDVDAEAPSGCSIDALVNQLRGLGMAVGATFIEHGPVWYRHDGEIRTATRPEFKALAESGALSPDTHVFDTSLTKVAQAREGALERPARESWHGRAFFKVAAGS